MHKTVLAHAELSFKGIELLESVGYKVINQYYHEQELIDFIKENSIEILYISEKDLTERVLTECTSLKTIGFQEAKSNVNEEKEYKNIQFIRPDEAHSQAVAELVFAHLLGMVRYLYDSNRQMPLEGEVNFDGMHQAYSNGAEIKGKTLGVIGFGSEAQATIKIALALGMHVLVFDKDIVKKTITLEFPMDRHIDFEIETVSLEEVYMKSDFITTHVTKEDSIYIGKEEFELMKMGVCLVNTSDSGIIDEVELMKSIDSGIVKHAALDCFDNQPRPDMRILMNPNISLSPNIAKLTKETLVKTGEMFAKQLIELNK